MNESIICFECSKFSGSKQVWRNWGEARRV